LRRACSLSGTGLNGSALRCQRAIPINSPCRVAPEWQGFPASRCPG